MSLGFRTFERYIAKEIYASVALVLIAFLLLFGFFDLIYEFESIGSGSYQIQHALLYVLLLFPGRSYELIPVAVLIGSLYALSLLARHSEITVLRASGASTGKFVWALVKIGLFIVVLHFLIGEFAVPPADRAAQKLRLQATKSLAAESFQSGLWVKDGLSFLNVREVTPEASLKGIRLYQFDNERHLQSISEAQTGTFEAPDLWHFYEVTHTLFEEKQTRLERSENMTWRSALNPDIMSVLLVQPERMSVDKLYRYVLHLQANHQKTDRYEIALWKKFIYPMAALVMLVLALPFAYLQDRMGNVSIKVFAGIMIGIAFHMLNGLFSSLGVINAWPPFFSAITPSLLFLIAAFSMLWLSERR